MERDTIFYMLNGEDSSRSFIPGVVVGGGEETLVVQFDRSDLDLAVDATIPLFYKSHGQFLCRDCDVLRVTDDVDGIRVKLMPRGGEPRRGDMRSSERIPAISESLIARLGSESDCLVLDVSTSGLAVVGGGTYQCGDVVAFEMWAQGGPFHGEVTVCNVIEVREGRFRYGLKCNADQPGQNLRNSLPQLWVTLQIRYLEALAV